MQKNIGLLLIACCVYMQCQQPPFYQADGRWARITLRAMTLEQKIGQLFMITVIIDQEANKTLVAKKSKLYHTDIAHAQQLITQYHVGGVIFLGHGTAQQQADTTQQLQQLSKIPLLIGLDAEWGLSMRLKDAPAFPKNNILGMLPDNDLIYAMARDIARQCITLGVHINFAPVVDVNNNPNNPVINNRSFGSDKKKVATKGIAYMQGLHDGGSLACAKHFPGHGDTTTDSHHDLPLLKHTEQRLQDIELYPFKQLIEAGVSSIMLAHLEIPALEPAPHTPSSLSRAITTDLLQQQMHFEGLCITDALDMHGVHKHNKPGNIELQALLAGNDILLCPTDVPQAVALIKQAIDDGRMSQAAIDAHVYKILLAKEWVLQQHDKNKSLKTNPVNLFSGPAQTIKDEILKLTAQNAS